MAMLPAELRDSVAGSAKFEKVSFLLNAQWWADNRPELRGSGDRRRQPRLICFSDISRCLTFRCA